MWGLAFAVLWASACGGQATSTSRTQQPTLSDAGEVDVDDASPAEAEADAPIDDSPSLVDGCTLDTLPCEPTCCQAACVADCGPAQNPWGKCAEGECGCKCFQ